MMKPRRLAALVAASLLVLAAGAVALPGQAADRARDHARDDRAPDAAQGTDRADQASDEADGTPSDNAKFGLCTAFQNNDQGRQKGQAGNAGPFQWLADLAGGAVDAFCGDVAHPSSHADERAA